MAIFAVDSGFRCLDLLATLHRRNDLRTELLDGFEALRTWSIEAQLPIASSTTITTADLIAVIELREAIYELMTEDPSSSAAKMVQARTLVNEAARHPNHRRHLASDGTVTTEPDDVAALGSSLARDAIGVLLSQRSDVKQCADEHCTTLFIDTSRGSRRRWCSMQRCGTRSKVNAHRKRVRQDRT